MLKQLHIIISRPYINCRLYEHLYKRNISRKTHPYIPTQHLIPGLQYPNPEIPGLGSGLGIANTIANGEIAQRHVNHSILAVSQPSNE